MKKIALMAASLALLASCGIAKTIDDAKFGLRGDLNNDDVKSRNIEWKQAAAGESKLIERSFENAPPMISHDISDFGEITKDNNACLSCHLPDVAAARNATPVPKSHLIKMENQKDLGGALSQERFNCTQCHAPQADAKPLVKNNFKADFRTADSKKKSNLIDILNQGAN